MSVYRQWKGKVSFLSKNYGNEKVYTLSIEENCVIFKIDYSEI